MSNKKITLDLQLTPKGEPVVDPGEGPGGLGPPPYFYTSEARRAGKCFFETGPPISLPSLILCEQTFLLLRFVCHFAVRGGKF